MVGHPWCGIIWGKVGGDVLAGSTACGLFNLASCCVRLMTAFSSAVIRRDWCCDSAVSAAELETAVESVSPPWSMRYFMRSDVFSSSCYLLVVVVVLVLVLLIWKKYKYQTEY